MSTRSKQKGSSRKSRRYSVDFKVRAVKLHLEEGYPVSVVSDELGMGHSTLTGWVKRSRKN